MEHDELTSVFNRAKFTEIAARELDTLRRYEMPLSGILFDIDHFRAVNENAGYTTGDKILITLARYVSSKVRKTDYVFRWRGGKFLILAPHTSADKAAIVAEKFRKIIEQKLFGDQTRLTISLGVAAARADDTVDDFAHRLQAALTGAKQNGRNTVVAIK